MSDDGEARRAGDWLARHGLGEIQPTPALAARLAVRWRARLLENELAAALIIIAALTFVFGLGRRGEAERLLLVVILSVVVIGLLVARSWLSSWVGRVDRRAAAALSRRVTLSVRPTWLALVGGAYVAVGVAVAALTAALAVAVLATTASTARYGAAVLLVATSYVVIGTIVQMRQMLTLPVVAQDEASLTADLIMRAEDARAIVVPTALWSLPVVLLLGTEHGWWTFASFAPMLVGLVGQVLAVAHTPASAAVARQAVGVR